MGINLELLTFQQGEQAERPAGGQPEAFPCPSILGIPRGTQAYSFHSIGRFWHDRCRAWVDEGKMERQRFRAQETVS